MRPEQEEAREREREREREGEEGLGTPKLRSNGFRLGRQGGKLEGFLTQSKAKHGKKVNASCRAQPSSKVRKDRAFPGSRGDVATWTQAHRTKQRPSAKARSEAPS